VIGRRRRLLLLLLLLLVVAGATLPGAAAADLADRSAPPRERELAPDAGRVPALWMPLRGPVVRGFEAPAGPYSPGHRGIDIAGPRGARVEAPATGRVAFAGPVAGVSWVSLLVAPGVVVTVGPLLDAAVTEGNRVRLHAPVGRTGPGHGGGARAGSVGPGHGVAAPVGRAGSGEGVTLHLSVRVDGVYVDPMPYLVDRPRPRLAPLPAPGGLPGSRQP
jgi:murein DD-endopeptidase MepM/ murein hydrolase activator NlpD